MGWGFEVECDPNSWSGFRATSSPSMAARRSCPKVRRRGRGRMRPCARRSTRPMPMEAGAAITGRTASGCASCLAQMHGVQHAWLCSSGTIAVELALRGLKVGPGDEVILAAYDFPGNFRAIEAIGARPVLVDLAPGTWTIDVEQVAAAISPRTKAIIVSHLHGSLADMRRLRRIRRRARPGHRRRRLPGARSDDRRQAGRIVGRLRRPQLRRQQAADGRARRGDRHQSRRRAAADQDLTASAATTPFR